MPSCFSPVIVGLCFFRNHLHTLLPPVRRCACPKCGVTQPFAPNTKSTSMRGSGAPRSPSLPSGGALAGGLSLVSSHQLILRCLTLLQSSSLLPNAAQSQTASRSPVRTATSRTWTRTAWWSTARRCTLGIRATWWGAPPVAGRGQHSWVCELMVVGSSPISCYFTLEKQNHCFSSVLLFRLSILLYKRLASARWQ